MPAHDRWLDCRSCGIRFLDAVEDQRRRDASGRPELPKLCPGCAALAALAAHRRGTVRWYDPRRGYGFIEQCGEPDVFVHRTGLARRNGPVPRKGQLVEYKLERTQRGERAVEVQIAEE